MKQTLDIVRLLAEIIGAIALAETGVMFLLPLLCPGVDGVAEALLDAGMLSCVAGPLILWRVRAAVRRTGRVVRDEPPIKKWRVHAGLLMLMISGFVATGFVVAKERSTIYAEAFARYDRMSERAATEVSRRVNQCVYGLKGARGVYAASKSIERAGFRAYVESRDLTTEFPGVLGIGFIERVKPDDIDAFIAAERADGAPDFDVFPRPPSDPTPSNASDLYVIKHIFPIERNRKAWGYDIGSEPIRRAAAELSIRTGQPTITERIHLLQDDAQHTGFLYFVPVYRNGSKPTTPEEREAALSGLLYVPIILEGAMHDLKTALNGQLDVELFDGDLTHKKFQLFDMDGHLADATDVIDHSRYSDRMFESRHALEIGGRRWTLITSTTPVFEASVDLTPPTVLGVGGVMMTLLLTATLWGLSTGRDRALAVARDMTDELRRASAKSDRLAEIARRTSNAVVVTDSSGRIEWVNEGFTRITGYALDEVVGRSPGSILQGPDTDRAEAARMGEAIRRGEPVRTEIVNYSKDGRRYIVDIEIVPVRGEHGALNGFMAVESDVTQRRDAERELAAKEERFRTLVEGTGVIVWEFDPTADRFTYVSPEAERLGYRIEEWYEHGFWERILHEDDRDRTVAECASETAAGRDHRLQYRMRRADGQIVWVDDVARVQLRDGKRTSLLGVFVDITEQKQVEAELALARGQAEAASRAKSEFLANMSHEIRTPLTAILGFADILRDEGDTARASESRIQTIDTIRNAGGHLLTVINDILDLSKIEAGKMEVERIETPLLLVLHEVASLVRPRASEKGVAVVLTLESPVPARILSDPTRLRQILMNLAGNAVKFIEQGSVTIATRAEHREGAQRLVIDVIDTGPGISPDRAAKLFQSFSQGDASVTRKHGGTGLGLTICRRLANLLGGEVLLAWSEPGRGTCFRLDLPLEAVAGSAMVEHIDSLDEPKQAASKAAVSLSGRILLAEDGEDNQRLIAFHLRKAGASVDIAANGRLAFEMIESALARGHAYDLLLSDMQMPIMDGYTLARTLRDRGIKMPVIALTAHAMAEDRAKCMLAGCSDYVTKPIDKAALLSVCAKWMPPGIASRAA